MVSKVWTSFNCSFKTKYRPASAVADVEAAAAAATVAEGEATTEDNVSSQLKLGQGHRPTSAVANVEAAVAVVAAQGQGHGQ